MKLFSQIVLVYFITLSSLSLNSQVTDINGKIYKTVLIGSQTWMAENLNVDRFKNGDLIPEVKSKDEWDKMKDEGQPGWCYLNFDPNNENKYGKLYNWFAINDSRGIAPSGFHVPATDEWKLIFEFLGSNEFNNLSYEQRNEISGKLCSAPIYETKTTFVDEGGFYEKKWIVCQNCQNCNSEYRKKVPCHVCKDERGKYVQGKYIPKTKRKLEEKTQIGGWCGTNLTGFSALPAGSINMTGGIDSGECGFWTSTDNPEKEHFFYYRTFKFAYRISLSCSGLEVNSWNQEAGFSVRLVKD